MGRDAAWRRQFIPLSALSVGVALVWACGGDSPTAPPPQPVPLRPTTVTVSPATAELTALGETVQLSAEAFDANGHAVAGAEFEWESSDVAVATVDGSGLVTAAGNGMVTITATTGDARGESAITVAANRAPAAVDSIPAHAMIPGDTASVDVMSFFTDPDGDDLSYSATSSDGQVLGVSVVGSAVTVVALAPGTAAVTVTATDPGGLSATQSTSVEGTTSILTAIRDMDAFFDRCPENDPIYARVGRDFEVRRNGEVVTDPIVCSEPASEMPRNEFLETTYPLQSFQAFRLAYHMNDGTEGRLPWTDKGLYDWLASNVAGINYKTVPGGGYCCDVIDGKLYISRPLTLSTDGETRPLIFPFIGYAVPGTLAFLVHEARHADDDDPGHVSGCLDPRRPACDAAYDLTNLGGYGVHYWMHAGWATGYLNVGIGCSERAGQYVEQAAWGANVLVKHFVTNPPPEVVPQPPYGGPCIPPNSPWR